MARKLSERRKARPRPVHNPAVLLLSITDELKAECRAIAQRNNEPMSVVMRRLIRDGIAADRKREKAVA